MSYILSENDVMVRPQTMSSGTKVEGELGRRIRAARVYGAYSQVEMARKLGISVATLIRYEKGRNEIPELARPEIVNRVIELTGVDADFLRRAMEGPNV